MNITNKYRNALTRIHPPGGNGCHPDLLGVATLGILAGLNDGEILSDIRQSIPPGRRHVPDREIEDAIRRARMDTQPSNRYGRHGHRRQSRDASSRATGACWPQSGLPAGAA